MMDINEKSNLQSVKLWQDENSDWFLRLEYLCENDAEIYKVIYPKVRIGLPNNPCLKQNFGCYGLQSLSLPHVYEDGFTVLRDKEGHYKYKKTISKKIYDMTLEEIEKKLGYCVRIIQKEDKHFVGSPDNATD